MSATAQDVHQLKIRRETLGGSVVLHASGDVDLATVALLAGSLVTAEKAVRRPAPVVLDLTQVTFLSAVGLAILVKHSRRCTRQGTPLRVVADQHAVLRPIQLTGLGDRLNLHPTLPHAMRTPEDAGSGDVAGLSRFGERDDGVQVGERELAAHRAPGRSSGRTGRAARRW